MRYDTSVVRKGGGGEGGEGGEGEGDEGEGEGDEGEGEDEGGGGSGGDDESAREGETAHSSSQKSGGGGALAAAAAGARSRRESGGKRATLCVSSQVGCAMGCTFCATGTMGKLRSLSAAEILEQADFALAVLQSSSSPSPSGSNGSSASPPSSPSSGWRLRNVVMMGMGEPLDAYPAVVAAVRTLTSSARFGLRRSAVTVSTVGVVPRIRTLARDLPGISLALSLHAPTQELRQRIVPSARAWPLAKLLAAVDDYQRESGQRVFVEYVLLRGVNDSVGCGLLLGELLAGRDVVVNLIPWNPVEAVLEKREAGGGGGGEQQKQGQQPHPARDVCRSGRRGRRRVRGGRPLLVRGLRQGQREAPARDREGREGAGHRGRVRAAGGREEEARERGGGGGGRREERERRREGPWVLLFPRRRRRWGLLLLRRRPSRDPGEGHRGARCRGGRRKRRGRRSEEQGSKARCRCRFCCCSFGVGGVVVVFVRHQRRRGHFRLVARFQIERERERQRAERKIPRSPPVNLLNRK